MAMQLLFISPVVFQKVSSVFDLKPSYSND